MKKTQLLGIILIGTTLFFLLLLTPLQNAENLYDSVIRIHVLANSDSDSDQEQKLAVIGEDLQTVLAHRGVHQTHDTEGSQLDDPCNSLGHGGREVVEHFLGLLAGSAESQAQHHGPGHGTHLPAQTRRPIDDPGGEPVHAVHQQRAHGAVKGQHQQPAQGLLRQQQDKLLCPLFPVDIQLIQQFFRPFYSYPLLRKEFLLPLAYTWLLFR